MNYPDFNSISIICLIISFGSLAVLWLFVNKISERMKRLERKTIEIISSFSKIHNDVNSNKVAISKKHADIRYMEGDIDLVKENTRATFKAIYHPRKIHRR